jgi:peptidoglycan/LPS O-acetylase OafA/YrhL
MLEFRNHDIIKLSLDNPTIITALFLVFLTLSFVLFRKPSKDTSYFNRENTDIFKGLAIVLIIIHHLALHTLLEPRKLSFFVNLGYVCVNMFLLWSGYGLSLSVIKKGLEGFFEKRMLTVVLPFIIYQILWAIITPFALNQSIELPKLLNYISGYKIIDRDYWFIGYILFWYIVFYVNERFFKTTRHKIAVYAIVVILTIIAAPGQFSSTSLVYTLSFPTGAILAYFAANKFEGEYNLIDIWSKKSQKTKLQYSVISLVSGLFIYIYSSFDLYTSSQKILNFRLDFPIEAVIMVVGILIYFIFKRYRKIVSILYISMFVIKFLFPHATWPLIQNILSLLIIFGVYGLNKSIFTNTYPMIGKFLGSISFELYMIHGTLLFTLDYIIYRGQTEFTFFIYLGFVILLSYFMNKFLSFIQPKINRIGF